MVPSGTEHAPRLKYDRRRRQLLTISLLYLVGFVGFFDYSHLKA